jgi:hypothetical protein
MIVRLLTKSQLDLLNDTKLHDFARKSCRRPLRRATAATGEMFADERQVSIDSVGRVLKEKLVLIEKLDRQIDYLVALGAASDKDPLYEALTMWVLERQLQGQTPLEWDAHKRIRRRRRFLPGG